MQAGDKSRNGSTDLSPSPGKSNSRPQNLEADKSTHLLIEGAAKPIEKGGVGGMENQVCCCPLPATPHRQFAGCGYGFVRFSQLFHEGGSIIPI